MFNDIDSVVYNLKEDSSGVFSQMAHRFLDLLVWGIDCEFIGVCDQAAAPIHLTHGV